MANNARSGNPLSYYVKDLNKLGRFLWWFRCIEIYPDGDGTGIILNWWHPLNYLSTFISVIALAFMDGFPAVAEEWKRNRLSYSTCQYFKDNPDLFEIIPRNVLKHSTEGI